MEGDVLPVKSHLIEEGARKGLTLVKVYRVELVRNCSRKSLDPLKERLPSMGSSMLVFQGSQIRVKPIDPGAHLADACLELLLLQVTCLKGVQEAHFLALGLPASLLSTMDLVLEKRFIHAAARTQLLLCLQKKLRIQQMFANLIPYDFVEWECLHVGSGASTTSCIVG